MEIIAFGNLSQLYTNMRSQLQLQGINLETRSFPDGETYLRVLGDVKGKEIILLSDLSQANSNTLATILLAETLRDLGASRVGLVAPYLPYMRQDKSFNPGEALSANYYAELISKYFDWLVTVDPHLHRYHSLQIIYSIPTYVAHAAPLIANWVTTHVNKALIVGPDSESGQWVKEVATATKAPFVVFEKQRHGDVSVSVAAQDLHHWQGYTPVLLDDIISSGHTIMESQAQLRSNGFNNTICIAVHGIFAGDAYQKMLANGLQYIVTSNSVPHKTNAFDLSTLICEGINKLRSAP